MNWEKVFVVANIPEEFWGVSLEDFASSEAQFASERKKVKDLVGGYVKKFPKVKAGLYIWGEYGVGKTMLMCWILQAILKRKIEAMYLREQELVDLHTGSWHDVVGRKRLERVTNLPIIGLDDLGRIRTGKHFIADVVDKFLTFRLQRKLPVLVTGNMSLAGVGTDYDPHIKSILSASVVSVKVVGPDHRLVLGRQNREEAIKWLE